MFSLRPEKSYPVSCQGLSVMPEDTRTQPGLTWDSLMHSNSSNLTQTATNPKTAVQPGQRVWQSPKARHWGTEKHVHTQRQLRWQRTCPQDRNVDSCSQKAALLGDTGTSCSQMTQLTAPRQCMQPPGPRDLGGERFDFPSWGLGGSTSFLCFSALPLLPRVSPWAAGGFVEGQSAPTPAVSNREPA